MNKSVGSVEDLVIEILLRIPIKSLIRFKLVSRHWLSLITDAGFTRRRNRKPNLAAVGVFIQNMYHYRYDYISLFPHESKFGPPLNLNHTLDPYHNGVLDSCNGLLLCYIGSRPYTDYNDFVYYYKYYVYNPTTNQSSIIPTHDQLLDRCKGCERYLGQTLVFDPVKSLHYSVLWVLPPCEYDRVGKNYRISVYSSDSRMSQIATKTEREAKYDKGVFCNGSVHWLSPNPGSEPSLRFVVDLQIIVDMPIVPSEDSCYYFGQSNDHLHYITFTNGNCDVFEIKDDYSEWILKHIVNFNEFPQTHVDPIWYSHLNYYGPEGCCSILCLVRGEKEADSFLVMTLYDEVVKYNLVNKNLEHVYSSKVPMAYFSAPAIQYIESLHCC